MKQNTFALSVSCVLHLAILLIFLFVTFSSPASFVRLIDLSLAEADTETAIEDLPAVTFDTKIEIAIAVSPIVSSDILLTIGGIGNINIGAGQASESPKLNNFHLDFANISKSVTHVMDATHIGSEHNTAMRNALQDNTRKAMRLFFLEDLSWITGECIEAVAFFPMEKTAYDKSPDSNHLVSWSYGYPGRREQSGGLSYPCDLVLILYKGQLPVDALRGMILSKSWRRAPLRLICIKNSPEISKSVESIASVSHGQYHSPISDHR